MASHIPIIGSGSLCEIYGHHWRKTKQKGKYQCSNCKKVGYCKGCCLVVPIHAFQMRCPTHKEAN